MASMQKSFGLHAQNFNLCTLNIQHKICSKVGWSTVSIMYKFGKHIYLGTLLLSKYGASAVYISYGPTHHTIYTTYTTHAHTHARTHTHTHTHTTQNHNHHTVQVVTVLIKLFCMCAH